MSAPNSTSPGRGEPDSTAHLNLLRSRLIVEELLRSGVEHFFIAPGSRSTPLVAAIAENERAETTIHYDERGAAFAALGCARATGRPAAWVTTSGTAVANGLPAVVEASVDEVPMILLTADRPSELRRTAANQTIDQPQIFGGYVRWDFDLPVSDPGLTEESVLTTVDQAVHRARTTPPGPVHLNLMFREPLIPAPGDSDSPPPDSLRRWSESDGAYTSYPHPVLSPTSEDMAGISHELRSARRGLVVAGRLGNRMSGLAAERLADALGWPLLTDVGSQMRLGKAGTNRVHNYDLLLASDGFRDGHAPDSVLYLGAPAVSKRLGQFFGSSRPASYTVVRESPVRTDPSHIATRIVESDVAGFCEAVASHSNESDTRDGWLSEWTEASEKVEACISDSISEELSEPAVARVVSQTIPEGHALVAASSMPVRDVDIYAAADGAAVPVVANRGASGIDGTIATAAGYAIGSGSPATVLIGDLALLHDLNSLAMLRDLPVTVIVVNNDGGGIFSMLPISEHETFFERYFGTPHGLGFERAAGMFGLSYVSPKTLGDFRGEYERALTLDGPVLIEVETNREENTLLRRRLTAEVSSVL